MARYRPPKVFGAVKTKEKREFKFPNIPIKWIIWIIIILVALYYFLLSPKFRIKDIIIEGNTMTSTQEILALVPTGRNILLFNVGKTENQILDQFPQIDNVQIYRGIPDALKVVVHERESRMVWQTGGVRYLISTEGVVSKQITADENTDLPVVIDDKALPVTVRETITSPNFIAFITNTWTNTFTAVNIHPTTFEISETTFDVQMNTDAGFYVKLNSLRSSKKQLDSLKTVLVEKRPAIHEYIDLRIDGWAYYK